MPQRYRPPCKFDRVQVALLHALPEEITQTLQNFLAAYFHTIPPKELIDSKDHSRRQERLIYELVSGAECSVCLSENGRFGHIRAKAASFYDALETNDSAVQVLGDDTLRTIAHELVETVRNNVTIDWTLRENAQALLRVKVKRILKKFGYPPDMQKKATETVFEQAALICGELAEA